MKILVTGSNGQLGRSIRELSPSTADEYIFTDVDTLDITDAAAVDKAVAGNMVDVIVNCAAYTDVNRAESDPTAAELLNATAVANLASAARANGAFLIHISTDYVFGGADGNTPRREDQEPSPTGVYGLTKLHGEQAITASGCRYIVLRTSWLYSEYGKNFVKTMLELTSTRPSLKVVFDQTGTPTYAVDLAKAIVDIISSRQYDTHPGIYHYSNEGVCSWYDFAVDIAAIAGHDDCLISPCHSDEFPSPVERPAYSVLDKTLFKETFGLSVPYWRDSLKKCINRLK